MNRSEQSPQARTLETTVTGDAGQRSHFVWVVMFHSGAFLGSGR